MAGAPACRPKGLEKELFDSVIVVTDRRILDDQIQRTVKQFMQVGATVGHAEHSGDLRKFIEEGKKIIVSTVQKFPFILDEIEKEKGRTFALIIDEAHSSQGGKTSAAMSEALADPEDTVNDALEKRMQARKMLTDASYFAFTATPKNKTLEMFGEPLPPDAEGKVKHRPFHNYTMKQAIQEGFILDVLKSYTPVDSYYKLVKKIEGDPEFDVKRARKKLRRYVEMAADPVYRNAKENTPNAARIEHDKALAKVMLTLLKDDTQVYKQFVENESFRRFVTDMVFTLTSERLPALPSAESRQEPAG